jgi:hypothetical protein
LAPGSAWISDPELFKTAKMKTLIDIRTNYHVPAPSKRGPWDQQIEELEQFFTSAKLPDTIMLDKCSRITDIPLFVKSHLSILRAQNGNTRYIPYMNRLNRFRSLICSKQNSSYGDLDNVASAPQVVLEVWITDTGAGLF